MQPWHGGLSRNTCDAPCWVSGHSYKQEFRVWRTRRPVNMQGDFVSRGYTGWRRDHSEWIHEKWNKNRQSADRAALVILISVHSRYLWTNPRAEMNTKGDVKADFLQDNFNCCFTDRKKERFISLYVTIYSESCILRDTRQSVLRTRHKHWACQPVILRFSPEPGRVAVMPSSRVLGEQIQESPR